MAVGVFGLFVALVGLAGLALWIVALVDALRRPVSEWEAAGQNQIVWVGVIVFASLIGALIYWMVARPQLESMRV